MLGLSCSFDVRCSTFDVQHGLPPPDRPSFRRLTLFSLKLLGWLAAHAPEFLLRALAALLGDFMYVGLRRRRRLMLSNLHHAFPARPPSWHRAIARESCRRVVETGLLSLATPYLSEARIRRLASLSPELQDVARRHAAAPFPVVFATAHMALWEAQTWMSMLSPVPMLPFGVIFRPLDNPAVDAFVKASRERHGMRLLSRKGGLADAFRMLRDNGYVGLLFDQNAGMQGALTLLFDRVCSTSELAGLLGAKFNAEVRTLYPCRTGFWRAEFRSDPIARGGDGDAITLALNRWLETKLGGDENLCASWLWAHSRWRNQDVPERRLRLEAKSNLLAKDLEARGVSQTPRRTRIWIRLPNWLGDVVMALPLIRALRVSRPDAELTLVAKAQFLPFLQAAGIADRLHPLPARGLGYWAHFWRLRQEHIDVWLLFTNSVRGDLEARLSGTRQRFGLVRPGKRRPLLSHRFKVPRDFDERQHHQLELWQRFLGHFGLTGTADCRPVVLAGAPVVHRDARTRDAVVGLIPGSENNPEKRWPVEHWRALVNALPDHRFVVFGTANDAPIGAAIAAVNERVQNLAGKTSLTEFAHRLIACDLLVTNDTGGMHLANALGVPLVALFGPTNPVRTGPVFSGPTRILLPPGAAPTGGASLATLKPETVVAEVQGLLRAPASLPAAPPGMNPLPSP